MTVSFPLVFASAIALLVAGCSDDDSGPCDGQNCSGHGTCVVSGGNAACNCDQGYEPQGLQCVQTGGNPVLHFSDIISGPKTGLGDGLGDGAIVTIWGNNLGSSQGTSTVYFEDSLDNIYESAHVYYWVNADGQSGGGPADLYTYHNMQEIAFSLPSLAADGAGKIYISVGGVNSSQLAFTVRGGNIYFVKTTGNDDTADGGWASPYATVSEGGASDHVSPGDIVYACEGIEEGGATGIKINAGSRITPTVDNPSSTRF